MDYQLEGGEVGTEVASTLRDAGFNQPVVIVTIGDIFPFMVDMAKQEGIKDWVKKPLMSTSQF